MLLSSGEIVRKGFNSLDRSTSFNERIIESNLRACIVAWRKLCVTPNFEIVL